MFFMFFPSQVPPSGPLQMYLPHQGRLIHGFPQNLAASVYYSISAASFLLFFSVPSFLTRNLYVGRTPFRATIFRKIDVISRVREEKGSGVIIGGPRKEKNIDSRPRRRNC